MCGIAGIVAADPSMIRAETLGNMAHALRHRGPEGEACWISDTGHAGLAHSRLAIIDLSAAGTQPMHDTGYSIVFNGEIYNYVELKDFLQQKGYTFRSQSDTEVLLTMYRHYGEQCLAYLDGMFAFAIWDETRQTLFCARDRFGEKPFFYVYDDRRENFYFGSEMKALYAAGIQRSVNHGLLLQFLAHGHTNDPLHPAVTFGNSVQKLPAAHFCTFSLADRTLQIKRYWDVDRHLQLRVTEKEAVTRFSELLYQSVSVRLRSDVPVGSSLSGGLDSSSIAAITSTMLSGRFTSFTAAFPNFEKDESGAARQVAAVCGIGNVPVAPSAVEFWADLARLMFFQEEPFTSASVYAQYRVFQLASENGVTVLLDGQGADETLAGYQRYRHWALRALAPGFTASFLLRREMARLKNNRFIQPDYLKAWSPETGMYKPAVRSLNDFLYFNTFQSGLEELLRYADRNSMAHGREVRLPFLSHELVSFAFSLPDTFKLRSGWTKWILRTTMTRLLPRDLVWQRKKTGFEPPQKDWMERPEGKQAISEAYAQLVKDRILNAAMIEKPVKGHHAYARESLSWRCLVSAVFLSGMK